MRKLLQPLWFLLAIVVLVESWLWRKTVQFGYWLVRLLPMAAFKRGVAAFIARLPPYAVLVVFGLPVLIIEPFKLAGIYLLTHHHLFLGVLVFIAAKLLAVAIIAFMFELCKDKLMQISWFPRFYNLFLRAWHWAHTVLDPYKERMKAALAPVRAALVALKDRALSFFKSRSRSRLAVAIRALRSRFDRARDS